MSHEEADWVAGGDQNSQPESLLLLDSNLKTIFFFLTTCSYKMGNHFFIRFHLPTSWFINLPLFYFHFNVNWDFSMPVYIFTYWFAYYISQCLPDCRHKNNREKCHEFQIVKKWYQFQIPVNLCLPGLFLYDGSLQLILNGHLSHLFNFIYNLKIHFQFFPGEIIWLAFTIKNKLDWKQWSHQIPISSSSTF